MTIEISNQKLQVRLARVARMLDRVQRWEHLAFMEKDEADRLLAEHEDANACAGDTVLSKDDAPAPAGPRSDKNKSRYMLSPGHGQHLSDLLRNTAEVRAMTQLSKLLSNG